MATTPADCVVTSALLSCAVCFGCLCVCALVAAAWTRCTSSSSSMVTSSSPPCSSASCRNRTCCFNPEDAVVDGRFIPEVVFAVAASAALGNCTRRFGGGALRAVAALLLFASLCSCWSGYSDRIFAVSRSVSASGRGPLQRYRCASGASSPPGSNKLSAATSPSLISSILSGAKLPETAAVRWVNHRIACRCKDTYCNCFFPFLLSFPLPSNFLLPSFCDLNVSTRSKLCV